MKTLRACKGADTTVGGTSAVAPLWAALIARFGQNLGKPVGFLNPLIYQSSVSSSAFNDVTQGDNDSQGQGGHYHAGVGWDPCTGLGSPKALLFCRRSSHPSVRLNHRNRKRDKPLASRNRF
ncbi:MAG TPA: hypothetical protein VHT28_12415 [Silvibacterium sp.]|nr:hypothetical protein [Silvibacterium sp.]